MTLLYMLKKASKITKKVFIRLFPLLMKVTDQVPYSFHSKNFYNDKWVMVYYMNLNAPSLFILLQIFRIFLMLLSTGNTSLCENMVEASEMTKKVCNRLFFLMKVTVQVPCSFHSWRMLQNVLHVDVSRQENFSGPRKRLLHKIL